jgi:4-hydroxybenzoate polyprenyltransferase
MTFRKTRKLNSKHLTNVADRGNNTKSCALSTKTNVHNFNILKNVICYLLGVAFFFAVHKTIDIRMAMIGGAAFLIAYQSIYYFNDLMDYESDRKNPLKRNTKPFARGEISREQMEARIFILPALGIGLGFFVNPVFGAILVGMVFLNFLYSYSGTRFKKNLMATPTLFLVEFMKFSCGWFALTKSLDGFPILVFLAFALSYIVGNFYYKNEINKKDLKISIDRHWKPAIIGVIALVSYVGALLIYSFTIPLLILIPLSASMCLIGWLNNLSRVKLGSILLVIIGIIFILSVVFFA